MMRALFVLLPALLFALPAAFLSIGLAAIIFAGFVGLGIQVTTARPERDEARHERADG